MRESAYRWPDRIAIQTASRSLTYSELIERVEAQAALLCDLRVGPGDRIAILSENRIEYLELQLAAARIGAIVACQNWRLTPHELQHCINLVSPSILICSEKQHSVVANLSLKSLPVVVMGQDLEERLTAVDPLQNAASVDPESGLIILYTSGTTGRPKAALISQRALCWRMCLLRIDLGITPDDAYLAWSPMFHMGGTEHSLSTLMMGGRVILTEGFNAEEMAEIISSQALGWLLLVPATLAPLMSAVRANGCKVKGIKAVGSMADLIPLSTIAELTNLLGAPFFNSFGSTETGLPPASGRLIPVGEVPSSLSKSLSSLCSMRIIESEGNEVEPGGVGEAFVRGPTLFSGYWGDKAVNQQEFANGWFRMGDLFRRNLDGSVDFVGRAKYLIKSGGENIYPAEIENVLLADPGVLDAIVVRRADERWGEVPVAVVSRSDDSVSPERLEELCRSRLAGYKQPKSFYFVNFQDLPRSATGKIIREDIEAWLAHRNT
jgi:fatty-acyl-CoA synthase